MLAFLLNLHKKFLRLTRCRHTAPGNAEEEELTQGAVVTLTAFKGFNGCLDGGMAGISIWVGVPEVIQKV